MSRHTLLSAIALTSALLVKAQSAATTALEPLASKHFTWPNIPYQVTGDQGGIRGPQLGYNLCNSTTENQQSLCQTLMVNSLADFCLWSTNLQGDTDTIGEGEAREVAWCVNPGHGTRVIPPGAITGAQFLYAKNYVQVVGFLDQTKVGLDPTDSGGELDPHGADEQGNPLGGIVFSNGFGVNSAQFQQQVQAGNLKGSQNFIQVIEWIDFMGSGQFCLKMCNPDDPNAAQLCNHIYDEIGCSYNALANYGAINGTFEVCDSDDMTPPGIFTAANGQVTTWFQPQPGPVTTIPYTPTIPSSSNCVTYSSQQLFAAAATDPAVAPSSTPSATPTPKSSGQSSSTGSRSGTGSAAPTGNTSGADLSAGGAMPFLLAGFMTTVVTVFAMLA